MAYFLVVSVGYNQAYLSKEHKIIIVHLCGAIPFSLLKYKFHGIQKSQANTFE